MPRRTVVYGPAYIDRVLLADRPLVEPEGSPPLDQSVDGTWEFGDGLELRDPEGNTLTIEPPADWPGPMGLVRITGRLGAPRLHCRGLTWHDDLGGMGAGFAAALEGELVSALGPAGDSMSRAIEERLAREGITHRPIRVPDRSADWTLLVTSGPHGDKLPVGFRGCHAAVDSLPTDGREADLRVVASFPNRLAEQALRFPGAAVRVFAPAVRSMTDAAPRVSRFADAVDVLCCNRREWELLDDREQVAWQVSLLSITDGPAGSELRFTTPEGEASRVVVPAFPRSRPPLDTNRAGEAYASTLLRTLLDRDWTPGVTDPALAGFAAARASAAAALVLDRPRFGFPSDEEIDAAMSAGRV